MKNLSFVGSISDLRLHGLLKNVIIPFPSQIITNFVCSYVRYRLLEKWIKLGERASKQ